MEELCAPYNEARGSPVAVLSMQVINRVLTVGERAGWGTGGADGGQQQQRALPERWVQFGSAASAHVDIVEELGAAGRAAAPAPAAWVGGESPSGACNSSSQGSTGRTLQDYLAVPPEDYSLLDPKWIGRLVGSGLRVRSSARTTRVHMCGTRFRHAHTAVR